MKTHQSINAAILPLQEIIISKFMPRMPPNHQNTKRNPHCDKNTKKTDRLKGSEKVSLMVQKQKTGKTKSNSKKKNQHNKQQKSITH